MQSLGKSLLAVFIVFIVGIIGFLFWNVAYMDVHYKLTVNVQTPEGIKSGYTVREITNFDLRNDMLDWPSAEGGNPAKERGEAVVVDLGERGVLFALIDSGSEQELFRSFPSPDGGPTTFEGIKYYANDLEIGSKATLPREHLISVCLYCKVPKIIEAASLCKQGCRQKGHILFLFLRYLLSLLLIRSCPYVI